MQLIFGIFFNAMFKILVIFSKNSTTEWSIGERGLPADQPLRWRIDKKLIGDLKDVEFRVRAYNAEGFGAYAYTEPEHDKEDQNMTHEFLLLPLVGLTIFLLLILGGCAVMLFIGESNYKI